MAGKGRSDLRSGEKKLPAAKAGPRDAGDASWHRGGSQSRLTEDGLLRPTEHGIYRAGQSDRSSWDSCAGSPDLGHCSAGSTAAGLTGVVASVLPFCPSACLTAGSAWAAARTKEQTSSATLPAANAGDGGGENEQTMDDARGALVPLAAGFRLRASRARWGAVSSRGEADENACNGRRMEPSFKRRWPAWTAY